jgi:hypothetical protein
MFIALGTLVIDNAPPVLKVMGLVKNRLIRRVGDDGYMKDNRGQYDDK